MIAREKYTGVNSITFNKKFKNDGNCYEYLSLVKWEDVFICRKCKNDKYYEGKNIIEPLIGKMQGNKSPTHYRCDSDDHKAGGDTVPAHDTTKHSGPFTPVDTIK